MNVGITGFGTFFPNAIETAADLVAPTGIPDEILREKMGIRQRHVAGPHIADTPFSALQLTLGSLAPPR